MAKTLQCLSAQTVEAMLRREQELRLCSETQVAFGKVRSQPDGVFEVVDALQRQVAREFGLPEEAGISVLRSAERWVGDDKARELCFYRHHRERCRDGPLQVGDVAPFEFVSPLPVISSSCNAGETTNLDRMLDLNTIQRAGHPLVLIAGSHS